MNYQKFIRKTLSSRQDSNLTAIAVIAGLAAGAALAVLFAPKSGRETRDALCDATEGLLDKFKSNNSGSMNHDFNDPFFNDVDDEREKAWKTADHLQGPEGDRKDPTTIKIPSAGTTAWKNNKIEDNV